jgi:glycerol-3-phosphate dehydrogenase
VTAAELRAHLRFGAVLHLDDLLLRRLRLGLWEPERARELAPWLGNLVREELSWDRRKWLDELDRFERALEGWAPRGTV